MYRIINIAIVLMFLIALIGSYYLGRCSKTCEVDYITKRDTIVEIRYSEPIVIERAKTKIVYKRDTIIETKPFVATIDTIIKMDTIYVAFNYPEMTLDVIVKKQPDTLMHEKIFVETQAKRAWWEIPVSVLAGTVVGYLLGRR